MVYRDDGRPQDLSIDPEDLFAAQTRARKKKLAIFGVVVVALAGGAAGTAVIAQKRARAELQDAWSRAAECLVGGGEGTPRARYRNRQLVAMATPSETRTTTIDAWPARCIAPVHRVSELARHAASSAELAPRAERFAKAIALDANVAADIGPVLEDLFQAAAAEGLRLVSTSATPEPRMPSEPMTLATLPNDALVSPKLTLSAMFRAPFGDKTLRFVLDDKDLPNGPSLCEFPEGSATIACKAIPKPAAAASPALRLWGTSDANAAPFLFVGDRGKAGIFRSDTGKRVVEALEYGAYGATALEDGSLGYLVWNEKPPETHFVRIANDGSRTESRVVDRRASGNPYYATSVFWQHVAYKSVDKPGDGIRLVLREITAAGKLGAPIDVGRVMETGQIEGGEREEPHLSACRSGDMTVIRAKGWRNTFLTFHTQGRWSPPVEASGLGGELQCRRGEAIVTRVWGAPSGSVFKGGVDMQRCTVSGCEDRSVALHQALAHNVDILPKEARDVRAVDVDGKMLLVWAAGDRGGLRMRLGTASEIGRTQDTVLYDDHAKGNAYGAESTLLGFQLWPTSHGALLLLGTTQGVYAFRIDSSGKLTPTTTTTASKKTP